MSKSFKKTKIFGIAGDSEKKSKRKANRSYRRKEKAITNMCKDVDIAEEIVFPVMDEVMNKWDMEKDGKVYIKNCDDKYLRK